MRRTVVLIVPLFGAAKAIDRASHGNREATRSIVEVGAKLENKKHRMLRSLVGHHSEEPEGSSNQLPSDDPFGVQEDEYPEDVSPTPAPTPAGTLLPTPPPPSPTNPDLPTTDTCTSGTKICIDFSTTPDDKVLVHGDYVKHEWFDAFGMTVGAESERGGYTPDGKARIYDTATTKGPDPDLRSPNRQCSPPGRGKGQGGEPGMPGENCEPQGNVLIVQECDKPEPDDNPRGGSITLSFDCPLDKFLSMGLLDIKNDKSKIVITTKDGEHIEHEIEGLGANSIQDEQFVDMVDVSSVELELRKNGGIRHVCFCLDVDKCRPPPLPTPVPPSPTPPPTQTKKDFTWSLKKNWKSNGDFHEGKGTRLFPPNGTEVGHLLPNATIDTTYPYDIDEEAFTTLVRLAFASWQSVIDIQFEQVESDADIVFEVVGNVAVYNGWMRDGDWYLTGAGGWGPNTKTANNIVGGRIAFGLYRRTTGSPPYFEEEYLDWMEANYVYMLTLHELGHVVGLNHRFEDKGQYSPDPLMNTAVMDYKFATIDGSLKQYLTDLDITRAQSRWGPSRYEPWIELWIPSWNKNFYTTSWDEANSLIKLGFAEDVLWFYGVLSKTKDANHSPFYRNYNGRFKHRYTVDAPQPPVTMYETSFAFFDEGIMGYLWRDKHKNLSPLYRFYSEELDNYIFSDSSEVLGYTNRTLVGYIIGINAMVGNATEQSTF